MTRVSVLGSWMHYTESGSGPTMLFLHGNPTSSYLWRSVAGPIAAAGYRCIALDSIGMGRSGKSRTGYRMSDHIAYVEAFIDAVDLNDITFVAHDWGVVMALDLARRARRRVRGVALMEGHIRPFRSWQDMEVGARELFSTLRRDGIGERMVLEDNMFIEVVLPSGILRELSQAEMNAYRQPFVNQSARLPILEWARSIPVANEPADVAAIVTANQQVLTDSVVPTLLLHGNPGAVIKTAEIDWCRVHGRSMTIVDVGEGLHFLPEDQPASIVDAVLEWSATFDVA